MKRTFAVFLLLLCAYHLVAQTTASVTQLTVNDGLSQGMVFDILQSRDGFIWIATKDGLNRYDGSRFKVFSPDPFDPFSLANSEVHSIFEDSRGWIWISLPEGLDVFDPVSGRFFHGMHEGKPFPHIGYEGNFSETPDGAIWFLNDDRIWKVSPPKDLLANAAKQGKSQIEMPCKPISISAVSGWTGGRLQANQLLFTQEKKLLIGTDHGLFRLDPATEQISHETHIPDNNIERLAVSKTGEILIRARHDDGNIWTLISDGKVIHSKSILQEYYSVNPIFDDTGHFWTYSLDKRTIQKWETPEFFNNGLPELEIPPSALHLENNRGYGCTAFMVDKSGIVWVGTSGYGLAKINGIGQKFKTALPGNAHRLMYEDPNGALYTGSLPHKKFLSKSFDRSAPNTDLPLFDNERPIRLAFDPAGNMWWMQSGGNQIYCMDAVTKAKTAFPFEGFVVICDRKGKLVSVNEKGLHRFDPNTQTSEHFPFEKPQRKLSENSYFLYEGGEGVVWIYGLEGVTSATPSQTGYRYEQYLNNPADRNSLSINHVLSICDDPLEPGRYLWLGTKGGGLNRLDKQSGKFKQYGKGQGLPDNVVYGILAQDRPKSSQLPGFIWMSTNKGLCRFDVRAETTKNFTILDGLQDNEFNAASYLKTRDGYLVFGGVNGINVFHPDSLHFNENVPQIHIVGLQVNNQQFDFSGKSSIRLSHDQNLLTFEFAALEFTNSFQNQYRYQLVPVAKDWVELGNKNSIQFANLSPGTYTFKVDGSNNDGVWSGQPVELRFTIRPPWWNSWWAYLIYLAMAGTTVWLFYNNRLRQKIEHQEALRLREMDEFKGRFFTNITHEFRTPLTVILGNLEIEKLEIEKQENHADAKISQFLNFLISKNTIIRRNSESLLRLINQILDLAKLESKTLKINNVHGDMLPYLRYISESLHSLANAQNLMLRVESDQPKIEMDYDPERLLQIVYNLLSNAIKFTPSGGKVVIRADLKDKWLHLSVSDTGAGIPVDELPLLFERFFQAKNQKHAKAGGTGIGLALTKELVNAMDGEISVESEVGKGTVFTVRLPVRHSSLTPKGEPHPLNPAEFFKGNIPTVSPHVGSHFRSSGGEIQEGNPQILIIEDNPDVVEYLANCLGSGLGNPPYALDFAYNGRSGIEKALETIPDLIVSDVMMPEKDGFEVVETLKNDERTSHIPIILLTAKADVESRLKGLRRGADAYLSKPFHQEELLVTVGNLLEMRRKLQAKYATIADFGLRISDSALHQSEIENPQSEIEDAFIQKFRSIVEANLTEADFELPQLERALAMSRSQIFRKVKALTGKPPSLFIRSIRLQHGRHLLQTSNLTISEIAYQLGYSAVSNFSDAFLEEFGERPTAVRG